MDNTIVIALISFAGTLFGTFGGIVTSQKLVNYRIEQLEKKVEKHNSIVERLAVLEQKTNAAFSRIDELREDIKQLS